MSLPSVVMSMVIFGICLTAMLQNYARGTAAMWNGRVNQEATAVAAWHSAQWQQQGCPTSPPPPVMTLAGRDVLPHEGFTVTCTKTADVDWPPALVNGGTPGTDNGESLTIAVEWSNRSHVSRSYEQVVLQPPTGP